MADLNYVSPLTSDLTDYYTKTEVDELQQGDENRFATQAQITAGDNEVKGWVASQGYLTQHQSLQNYATKEYVDDAIEDIEIEGGVKIRVVSNLPANPEENVIYLTHRADEEDDNIYNEWIWVADTEDFELIGDTSTGVIPDLTNYATKSYVDTAVAGITIPDVSDFITERQAYGIAADEAAAQVSILEQSLATVAKSGSYNDLSNKPVIPAAPDLTPYATKSELSAKANAADLATVATSGSYNDLSNKPTIPSTSGLASETYVDNAIAAIDIPDVSDMATETWVQEQGYVDEPMAKGLAIEEINNNVSAAGLSGDYDDLSNKPTIPTVPTNVSSFTNDAGYLTSHQDISGKANIADLATVATSGDYDDLTNKPTIPSISGLATETYVDTAVAGISVPANTSDLTNDSGFITSSDLPDTSGFVESSDLATVATTGDYDDLTNKPTIPVLPTLATVATSGSYNDLSDKPTIPEVSPSPNITMFLAGLLDADVNYNKAPARIDNTDTNWVSSFVEKLNSGEWFFLQQPAGKVINASDLGLSKMWVYTYSYDDNVYSCATQGITQFTFPSSATSDSTGSAGYCCRIGKDSFFFVYGLNANVRKKWFLKLLRNRLLYDNTTSGLTATTVQGAIDELAAASGSGSRVGWAYDSSTGYMTFTGMRDENYQEVRLWLL